MNTYSQGKPTIMGVDVGYGNTKVHAAFPGDNTKTQSFHFPSMAVAATSEIRGDSIGAQLDVYRVNVGKGAYYVGPDVGLLVQRNYFAELAQDYPETDTYMALLYAAFLRANLRNIDLLVLGLPGRYYKHARLVEQMKERFVGDHLVGEMRVTVREVHVLAQPVGGLASFGTFPQVWAKIKETSSLVIDGGYNTLDWCAMKERKVLPEITDSVACGMAHFLKQVWLNAEQQDASLHVRGLHEVDAELAKLLEHEDAKKTHDYIGRINGSSINLSEAVRHAMTVWNEAVSTIISNVGPLKQFDGIYLVGGAAPWLNRALQARGIEHAQVSPETNTIMCNAIGFYVAGVKKLSNSAAYQSVSKQNPPPLRTATTRQSRVVA